MERNTRRLRQSLLNGHVGRPPTFLCQGQGLKLPRTSKRRLVELGTHVMSELRLGVHLSQSGKPRLGGRVKRSAHCHTASDRARFSLAAFRAPAAASLYSSEDPETHRCPARVQRLRGHLFLSGSGREERGHAGCRMREPVGDGAEARGFFCAVTQGRGRKPGDGHSLSLPIEWH